MLLHGIILTSYSRTDPGIKQREGRMASAERESITGSGIGAPSGVQGQSSWSGGAGGEASLKLKAF